MTIAYYGFQAAPNVRFVIPETGWLGWFEGHARPLIEQGHPAQHLHNPFGLYDIRDRQMHIDQFELAYLPGPDLAGRFRSVRASRRAGT